ncbi:RNA-directed DNA polymerase [Streptomyces clavuligerus]|nr:RNA-directed DNA polymerase [Streptomyces clavuligerus]QPJ92875.1 recombinase [Streptomyces clavuligerus]QPL65015.1 RNA-directed DNA polymerase [Streptomyces clavuligerus]QPL95242.1 RNA-directed DNA polymerase [Streptomyces clavuligerus]WDN51727.1 RNA-directed DNA polymerase [Streptomyces clavuligerus]
MSQSFFRYLEMARGRLFSGRGQSEVPDIINFADINSSWVDIQAGIVTSIRSGHVGPDYVEILNIPKNSVAVRPIARLSVQDRLVYDTLVFSIANLIDSELHESVYSARWSKKGKSFWSPVNSWVSMQKRGVAIINTAPFQLARTDITSFYEHIDVSTLGIDIESVGADRYIVERLITYLRMFQTSSHAWGIPQGPDASAILANLYLLPVDEFIRRSGMHYLRYSDDMMLFDTESETLRDALLEINSILRSRRLSMSSTKTGIYNHSQSLSQLEDLEKDAINYSIKIRESGATERLYKLFTESTEEPQRDRDVKFSLFRMGRLKDDRAIHWVIRNLKDSHHLASNLLHYLECFPERYTAVGRSYESTMRMAAGHKYDHLEQRVLQAATRQKISSKEIRDLAWDILNNKNKSNLPREFAARYLGRVSTVADGQLLRREFEDESNTNVRRALLVAMYEARSISRPLLKSLANSDSQLSWVSRYLLTDPLIPLPR